MAGSAIKISILADTKDLQRDLGSAESAMKGAADTADRAGREINSSFDATAEGADTVASKGAQAAGALSGLGDLVGGKFGAAMVVGGTAMQAFADAGDLVNAAIEGGGKLMGKAVGAVRSLGKAETYASAAKKVSAGAQWALNAAMSANPIGLLVVALVALVAAFVVAYKKSETFRNIVNGAFGAIQKVVGKVLPAIRSVISGTFHAIETVTRTVWNGIKAAVTDPIGTAKKVVTTTIGALKSAVSTAWNAIKGATTSAWNGIKDKVVGPFNSIVDTVRSVPGRIRDLYSAFKSAGGHVLDGLVDGLKSAGGFVSGIAGNVWNAIKGMLNSAIDHINAALDFSVNTHIPGVGTVHISAPDIPHLASGGITTGPTMAVIGDNPGGREAVIPLDKYALGGNTYNIDVYVAPGGDLVEAGRQMTRAIDAYERAGGRRRA